MSKSKHLHVPKLSNINHSEAVAVAHMFSLYDYKSTGRIPSHLAEKLITLLGCEISESSFITFPAEVTLTDFFLILDKVMPPPEPVLASSLSTFLSLVSKPSEEGAVLKPEDISSYMESLGRPPPAEREIALMLSSMQDYDDCSQEHALRAELFIRELTNFHRKTASVNKDFR
mmetsp:Transcript_14160/g.23559  ORF Transcript_14160/g.23559 Transcript_14160/m.23559 type:complete len:173 (+) Transcript_14160:52-570(+)